MKGWMKTLVVLVAALMLLGAILVFSASGTYSASKFDSYYHLFRSHLWKVLFSAVLIIIFSLVPYDYYRKYSKKLMYGIILLLVLTLIFAPKVKGAARWIDLGVLRFQPSELAKVILIMHIAVLIEKKGELLHDFKNGFAYALFWIGIISGLVMLQPNVSTSLIIAMTAFTLLYVGGARLKHITFTLGSAAMLAGSAIMLFQHSRERVLTYIQSFTDGKDINIQVTQAKIALGSGGLFGVGLGHSRQSDLFLPESYGDFIFSILGEELGMTGAIVVLFMYLLLFVTCLVVAKKAQDKFGQLLVLGLGFNIMISALINAAVVTGLIPTTGITLPFISFGGTSIMLYGISIGIIINVGRQTMRTEELKLAQV